MTNQKASGNYNAQASEGSVAIVHINGVSLEQFAPLVEELGVTKAALKNFFNTLQQHNIAPEEYDYKLREIAEKYLGMLTNLESIDTDNPEVQHILKQAEQALQQGNFDQAEDLFNKASEKEELAAKKLKEKFNDKLLSAANAKAQNGELKLIQFNYKKAANYFQKAAEIAPPELTLLIATYLTQAGVALLEAKLFSKAEPVLQRALQINDENLRDDHPIVANSINNLAALYRIQGEYDKAEPLFKLAIQFREKAFGPESPEVAISLNSLSVLYSSQNKHEQAEQLLIRALKINKNALGAEHPDVAFNLRNLAIINSKQKYYVQARELFKQSLNIYENFFGLEHPKVADVLKNLAGLYYRQRQYNQARPLYQQSLKITEKVFGSEHPDVIETLNILAELYYVQGNYDQAETLLRQALEINTKVLGKEHPHTNAIEDRLGLLQSNQCKSILNRISQK